MIWHFSYQDEPFSLRTNEYYVYSCYFSSLQNLGECHQSNICYITHYVLQHLFSKHMQGQQCCGSRLLGSGRPYLCSYNLCTFYIPLCTCRIYKDNNTADQGYLEVVVLIVRYQMSMLYTPKYSH